MIEVTDEMLKVARSMRSFELMIKRIIELHEQSKWVNVEKGNPHSYPNHQTDVLCVFANGYMDVCTFDYATKQFYQADDSTAKVISWQPLPEFKE